MSVSAVGDEIRSWILSISAAFFPPLLYLAAFAHFLLPLLPNYSFLTFTTNIVLMAIINLTSSYMFYAFNGSLTRLFEGYTWINTLYGRLLLKHKKAKYESMVKSLDFFESGSVQRMQRRNMLAYHYPSSIDRIMPTDLGNIIAAFEDYPSQKYGVDIVRMWPQIIPTLKKENYYSVVVQKKAVFDFLMNMCIVTTLLVVTTIWITLVYSQNYYTGNILLIFFSILLVKVFYAGMLSSAFDWGVTVRTSFDLYYEKYQQQTEREDRLLEQKQKDKIQKREVMMKNPIRILHLSDLHLKSDTDTNALLQPLFDDLEDQTDGLGIDKIHYMVITGDFTNCASKDEFKNTEKFCTAIKERYELPPENILLVPGNHDLDWDEEVYELTLKRKVDLSRLTSGKFVEDGKAVFIRVDDKYPNRFKNFSKELYRSLTANTYPLPFDEQCIPIYFNDHKIQFLLMNSSWEIDEHFPERSGILSGALSKGLLSANEQIKDAIKAGKLNDASEVLKIACWHHPVSGNEKIVKDAFMENIQKADFKLCLHGHVHEERADLFGYLHPTRKIHIIGAGSFDAPSSDRPESIPRIYNLLEISTDHRLIRVHTRCKMKHTGAWSGWAVWPNGPHSKRSYYEI